MAKNGRATLQLLMEVCPFDCAPALEGQQKSVTLSRFHCSTCSAKKLPKLPKTQALATEPAISQPVDMDVNEIIFLPRRQEMYVRWICRFEPLEKQDDMNSITPQINVILLVAIVSAPIRAQSRVQTICGIVQGVAASDCARLRAMLRAQNITFLKAKKES